MRVPARDVAHDQRHRGVDPGEARGVVAVAGLQPGARGGGIAQAAPREHLRHREAHAELALEREDVGDGDGGDVESALHGPRKLGAGSDG